MAKITFRSEQFGVTSEKVLDDVDTLNDVLFHFTDFLRGVGYVFDGNVEIVNERDIEEDMNQLTLKFNDFSD